MMKTSRKTAKRLGTSLLCLSLFASSGSIMVNGIFAAPPTTSKPGQTNRSAQQIPTTVVEDKGTQQTGGVGSFFKGVGNKMKGAFKSDSEKGEQERSSTSKSAPTAPSVTNGKLTPQQQQTTTKQTVTPQAAPSQVTRNNPMRPNNVASVPAKPAEPGKLNSQMTGMQTNEVMKQLEELYKADGRTMPDMGALRDSHTETAQQVKKMDQKATVRPSELSDNPLTKARAYIPGMDKPIETPKLVDKELPSILPETRVDVKESMPSAPGPMFVPPSLPETKPVPTPTPKVVKAAPAMSPPSEDSMAWTKSAPAVTPQPAPALPPAGPMGMFPDAVATTKAPEVKPTPVVKPSTQHPLLDAAPAATVNKAIVTPPAAGMFPDAVTATPTKTPTPKTTITTSTTPSLGAVGKFPGNDEPAVAATKSTPKATPKMDEDHFFVIETENDVEDMDISKDIVAKPAAIAATPVSATPATKQPTESSTAPYRPDAVAVKEESPKTQAVTAQPVKVEAAKLQPKNTDSPFVAANEAAANAKPDPNNPFKFPEGGLMDADEALAKAPKVEAKPAEIKTADATPSFLPEAPKPKAVESQPAQIPMVLPPAPTFPNDEFSDESPVPETKSLVPAPAPKVEDKVAESSPKVEKVETKKEKIDSDLVIEGDPAFSAMALAEAAAKASREQDEDKPVKVDEEATDAFIIPPLPGTADEAVTKSSDKPSDDQPDVKFDDIPMLPSTDDKSPAVVKKDDAAVVMPSPAEKPIVAQPVVAKKPTMTPQQKYELISGRKNVRGFKGFCPVALRDSRELLDTEPEFQVLYQEKLYYFSSNDAKRRFEGDPEHYLPASSGRDVVIFKDNSTIEEGMLDFAVWYQGRLYLFASKESMTKFSTSPSEYAVGEALIETTSH